MISTKIVTTITSKLFLLICFFSCAVLGQERITKRMAGPANGQYRIAVAFITPTDESYKLQSLIIDIEPVKNKKDLPTAYYADLTTTVRSLTTGSKDQKILVIRWNKGSDVEVKCDGGRWTKETTGPELDAIVEVIKQVVKNSPLDAKDTTEFTLPTALEQKITTALDSLTTSSLKCIRGT
jgi:hypothetical protein